jgi:hypothetical protein
MPITGGMSSPGSTVTCVVPAYNYAEYVVDAVRSALAQDYPAALLDVVVVDDGSTDGTGELLERTFGDEPRVTLIRQANQGFVAAMNRGIAAATGDLIGLLDADDRWPPDRLRRQVAIMEAKPSVGLVHGDLRMVGRQGETVNPSFFAYSRFQPARGRVLGALIRQNHVTTAAMLMRASLRERFLPIPEELVYPDWYMAARIAEVAEVDFPDGTVADYRLHGDNMGNGRGPQKFFNDMRNNVRIQRWMLRHLDLASVSIDELHQVVETMAFNAARAASELGCWPGDVLPVDPADREEAAARRAGARAADEAGRGHEAVIGFAQAFAADPFDGAARAELVAAALRAQKGGARVAPPATRRAAVLAFAGELVEEPALLSAYAQAVSDGDDVTLLVHTTTADAAAHADALGRLVAEAGLDAPGAADLLLCPDDTDDALLAAPVRAVYTRGRKPSVFASVPRVDDGTLDRLPALLGIAA